jgi:hypothetical protein
MRAALVALLIGLTAAGTAVPQTTVYRCEDARGRVTYSDAPCPSDVRTARKLEDSPVLKVGTADDATKADPAALQRPAGRVEVSRPGENFNPVQEDEKISAQIAAQRRACEALASRIRFLEVDVAAASASSRSSAELALRRAQDEYLVQCPRR